MWYQKDGDTCPTARSSLQLIHNEFGAIVVLRYEPPNWLPKTLDLPRLNYFLWLYVKSII